MFSFRKVAITALLAVSCALGADPALLRLLDPDSKVVGGANVSRTMSSPFGQFVLNQIKDDEPGFREFVTATGFDPRRDIRDVVFASPGELGPKNTGLVIATGVFNGPQILAAAKAKGGTVTTYKNVEILQAHGTAIAVVNGLMLMAGAPGLVTNAIDRLAISALPASAQFRKAADLMNRYDAWMLSTVPGSSVAARAPQGSVPGKAVEGITEVSGGVLFGADVQLEGEAVTRSEKDAQALVDVVKFLTGMMQLNRENPDLAKLEPILNSLQIQQSTNTVRFALRVPQTDLEQLMSPKGKKTVKRVSAR